MPAPTAGLLGSRGQPLQPGYAQQLSPQMAAVPRQSLGQGLQMPSQVVQGTPRIGAPSPKVLAPQRHLAQAGAQTPQPADMMRQQSGPGVRAPTPQSARPAWEAQPTPSAASQQSTSASFAASNGASNSPSTTRAQSQDGGLAASKVLMIGQSHQHAGGSVSAHHSPKIGARSTLPAALSSRLAEASGQLQQMGLASSRGVDATGNLSQSCPGVPFSTPGASSSSSQLPQGGSAIARAASSSSAGSRGARGAASRSSSAHGDTEGRLSCLESELAQFTAKMEEMRVKVSTRGDTDDVRSQSASQRVGSVDSSRVLRDAELVPTVEESTMRKLREELRAEAEARKQATARLESLIEGEGRVRDEALLREAVHRDEAEVRLEQHWDARMKEETALLRAVTSNIEARVAAMQREVRIEMPSVTAQNQKLSDTLNQIRDGLQKEIDLLRSDMGEVQEHMVKFRARMKQQEAALEVAQHLGASGSSGALGVTADPGAVNSEVQRQLTELQSEVKAVLRADLAVAVQDAVREEQGRTEERRVADLQAKLDDVRSELKTEIQRCVGIEARTRQEALQQEAKEREETCYMLLKSLEEKIAEERRRCDDRLQEERRRFETGMVEHERVLQREISDSVGKFVEQSKKDHLTTQQDVLELREELSESLRLERESRDQALTRLRTTVVEEKAAAPVIVQEADTGLKAVVDMLGAEQKRLAGEQARLAGEQIRMQQVLDTQEATLGAAARESQDVLSAVSHTRDALASEAAARSAEIASVRSSLDGLQEQVAAARASAASTARAGASEDLRAALQQEIQAREDANEQVLGEVRELLREERQTREQMAKNLELRVQSGEQTIFVDSGKREERDRDLSSDIARVQEDVDTVKRQMVLQQASPQALQQQRQRIEEMHEAQRAVEGRLLELAGRLDEVGGRGALTRSPVATGTSGGGSDKVSLAGSYRDGSRPGSTSLGLGRVVGADEVRRSYGDRGSLNSASNLANVVGINSPPQPPPQGAAAQVAGSSHIQRYL